MLQKIITKTSLHQTTLYLLQQKKIIILLPVINLLRPECHKNEHVLFFVSSHSSDRFSTITEEESQEDPTDRFYPIALRAVRVLFSPMVSGWAVGRAAGEKFVEAVSLKP